MTITAKEYDKYIKGPAIMANETKVILGDDVITSVPWRYARSKGTEPPYGTYGVPLKPRGPFTPEFFAKLQAAIQDLYIASSMYLMPPGWTLDSIVVASTYRKAAGKHSLGRAIDIDSIWWKEWGVAGKRWGLVMLDYLKWPARHLAAEALLRLHCGTVLSFPYNEQHHCHFHIDDGTDETRLTAYDLDSRHRRVKTLFMQHALYHVWGINPGPLDGKWGRKTASAFAQAMNLPVMLSPGEIRNMLDKPGLWRSFLIGTVRRFKNSGLNFNVRHLRSE